MNITITALAVLVCFGMGVPWAISLANERTAFGRFETYDTHLDKNILTPEMFADAVFTYHRITNNQLQELLKIIFERRLSIIGIDRMKDGNWKYQIRAYTYLNIPIITGWYGIGGEPTLGYLEPMREF